MSKAKKGGKNDKK